MDADEYRKRRNKIMNQCLPQRKERLQLAELEFEYRWKQPFQAAFPDVPVDSVILTDREQAATDGKFFYREDSEGMKRYTASEYILRFHNPFPSSLKTGRACRKYAKEHPQQASLPPYVIEDILGIKNSERRKWTGVKNRLKVVAYVDVHLSGFDSYRHSEASAPCYDFFQALALTPELLDRWRQEDREKAARAREKKRTSKKTLALNAARKRKRDALKKTMEKGIRTADIIVLDTETTGLDPRSNAIVELAIVTIDGKTLFHQFIRPTSGKRWTKEAQDINGITPKRVEKELTMNDYRKVIQTILSAAKQIIGYNINFDTGFLSCAGFTWDAEEVDVMQPFTYIYGQWHDYWKDYTWQPLVKCAAYYGYEWTDKAHGALADTLATLYCYQKLHAFLQTEEGAALLEQRRQNEERGQEEFDEEVHDEW